jgi:KRAB domain-containing zinc finger protein
VTRLTTHKFTHTANARIVKCQLCPSDRGFFKDERFLRTHIRSHSFCFKCAICDYATKTKQVMKIHLWTLHFPDMRRFPCVQCDKIYSLRSQLMVHTQRIHRGERPFTCDVCSKNYRSSTVLQKHKRIVHNKFRYVCKFCNKEYSEPKGLIAHLFTTHRDDKPYNCPECHNGYISQKHFKNHLRKCHNIIYDKKVHFFKGFSDVLKNGLKPTTHTESDLQK